MKLITVSLCFLVATIYASFASPSCFPLFKNDVSIGTVYDAPSNQSIKNKTDLFFDESIALGQSLYQVGFEWSTLEPQPKVYNTEYAEDVAKILGGVGLVLSLSASTINTNTISVPSDLADPNNDNKLRPGLTWDSAEVIDRYEAMLHAVLPVVTPHATVAHFNVGNEIDSYLPSVQNQSEYLAFFKAIKPTATSLLPSGASVGNTFTFYGLQSLKPQNISWVTQILSLSDGVPLTYYPLNSDFSVKDPTIVETDIPQMLQVLPADKCLLLNELGYPSGWTNGSASKIASSTQKQSDFVQYAFDTIQKLQDPRIRGVSAFKLVDWTVQTCQMFENVYGVHDPRFLEYLCTLGFVNYNGTAKPAVYSYFQALNTTKSSN